MAKKSMMFDVKDRNEVQNITTWADTINDNGGK
jgi:hypothetical protein